MSQHNKPQSPELVQALKDHGLKHDTPSQLADSFRAGWKAGLAQGSQAVPDDMGYSSLDKTGPVGVALQWLKSALSCQSFPWDGDQRDCAESSLADALAWMRALGPVPASPQPGDPVQKDVAVSQVFPLQGDEVTEDDLSPWQAGSDKPATEGRYLRDFDDEGVGISVFIGGEWTRDGFFASDIQYAPWRGLSKPTTN